MLDRLTIAALQFLTSEKGASSIEYALVAALISLAALAAFQSLSDSISSMFGQISSNFSATTPDG